jgi:hypothetical protein
LSGTVAAGKRRSSAMHLTHLLSLTHTHTQSHTYVHIETDTQTHTQTHTHTPLPFGVTTAICGRIEGEANEEGKIVKYVRSGPARPL